MTKPRLILNLSLFGFALVAIGAGVYFSAMQNKFSADTGTARIYIQSSKSTFTTDEQITASLVVDGGGQSFTSFRGDVSLNNLTVTAFSLGSAVTNWKTTPNQGSLNFFGGVQGTATNITVYTLTLRASSAGAASISLSNGSIYQVQADGMTTLNIIGSLSSSANYSVSAPATANETTTTTTNNSKTSTTKVTTNNKSTANTVKVDVSKSTVIYNKTSALADGKESACLTISLKDINNKPITSIAPDILAPDGVTISTPTVSGSSWISCLTTLVPGDKKIDVSASSLLLNSTIVNFVSPNLASENNETVKTVSPKYTADTISGEVSSPKSRIIFKNQLTSFDNIIINGKAEPNSKLLIYIFSDPKIQEVVTNEKGLWSLSVGRLKAGSHRVEAMYVRNPEMARKIIANFTVTRNLDYLIWMSGLVLLAVSILISYFILRRRRMVTQSAVLINENSQTTPINTVQTPSSYSDFVAPVRPIETINSVNNAINQNNSNLRLPENYQQTPSPENNSYQSENNTTNLNNDQKV